MAKKEAAKNVLDRVYNVPLRKEYMKAPNWKRTPKAVKALRQFISKHMKSENVIIGKYANQLLWKDGIKNPPHHIRVNAVKDDKGKVMVELVDLPGKAKRESEKLEKRKEDKTKKEEVKKEAEKKEEKIEAKIEEIKQEKEEKAKDIQKEEIKELKEEQKKHHAAVKQPKEQRFQETHPTAPRSQ